MIASEMMRPAFWLAAVQIMGINILLSGDNAVVIALAVRELPPKERFWGMVLGAGCAAVLLILFTGIVATLLKLPYLKLIGGIALFWVAVKLVAPQAHGGARPDLNRRCRFRQRTERFRSPPCPQRPIHGPSSPRSNGRGACGWCPPPPWQDRSRP